MAKQLNLFSRAPDMADRHWQAMPIDERLEIERQEKMIHKMVLKFEQYERRIRSFR